MTMSTPAPDLDRLQRWMQAVITHPDGVAVGIGSEQARGQVDIAAADVEEVISRSRALDSIARLQVYGNAYYARLIGCLATEFPAVHSAVGEESFSGFVYGYLQQFPSTSYTLAELGRSFPEYLADSRPPRERDDPDSADFLIDLARLERTYSEVFDGPGEEQQRLLTADDLLSIAPDRWGDLRLQTAASLRLLTLRFPVQEYAAAVRKHEDAVIPPPATTRLAIHRRDYIVRRRPLSELPFCLLGQLQQGLSLSAAIESALSACDEDPTNLADRLQEWFRLWTREGYFIGVGFDPK